MAGLMGQADDGDDDISEDMKKWVQSQMSHPQQIVPAQTTQFGPDLVTRHGGQMMTIDAFGGDDTVNGFGGDE